MNRVREVQGLVLELQPTRCRARILLILAWLPLLMMWLPGRAFAQGPVGPTDTIDWRELETENFLIVYAESVYDENNEPVPCSCGISEADRYAAFIDNIYRDMVAIFETELQTPVNLRLFPTEESYYEVNPLAERLTGVIAHALNSREEIAIAVPRTTSLSDEELVNNIRHEMTHLFASLLSDGKLKAGFQEGIAQYLEKPLAQDSYGPALLQEAFRQSRLLSWADLDDARRVYSDPQVAYPQTLSVVSFLVDRYGVASLLNFMRASAEEPGYRSALEVAYGKPADELEAEWRAYLPQYFEGRWQINALYTYDLGRVRKLVEKGVFTDAETEITDIIALLETTSQHEILAEAESLLARAHQGRVAAALADEARTALSDGDYSLAIEKGQAALAAYDQIGYRDRVPEIQVYIHRATLGQGALAQLDKGEQLLDSLRFFEAESQIYEATVLLQALDNQVAAEQGTTLLLESARRQGLLTYALLAVGLALLVINGFRRLINRFSAHPLEVEFT